MDLHLALRVVLPLVVAVGAVSCIAVLYADGRWVRGFRPGPPVHRFGAFLDTADSLLLRWYARVGLWTGSLVIALLLVLWAYIHVNGGTEPWSHGLLYASLSEAPWDVDSANFLRNRILAPLIGWVLHLRGPLFVFVPWFFLVGLVALVNVWCRREGAPPTLAFCAMLAIVFSPVGLQALAAPGLVDVVGYFMCGMALLHIRRPFVSCAFMALGVMAHDASAFLLPAWLVAGVQGAVPWRTGVRRSLILALLLLPYACYRWWALRHDASALSTSFYFSRENVAACLAVGPLATMAGAFAAFRLHGVVLAVLLFMGGLRDGRFHWALLLMVSVSFTLLIAFDTTRMLCWAFPAMVIGVVVLGVRVGRNRAVALLFLAWVLNFLIPAYTTTAAVSYRLREIRAVYVDPGVNTLPEVRDRR
ncbi:MAG: hypothetical protein KF797_00875 [Flavobacteriales bacterium]|nr:hypothetical protein [Flavobacteriales bacterium]